MITDAIKAADALLRAVPLLQGSHAQQDYREALELVEYLLENDERHPLIDMLAKKIAEYEDNSAEFTAFRTLWRWPNASICPQPCSCRKRINPPQLRLRQSSATALKLSKLSLPSRRLIERSRTKVTNSS